MSDTAPWHKPTQLLIVEDEPGLARALERRLSTSGRVVDVVGSAEDARRAMQLADYDVALIDMQLPDGAGIDLVPDLKRCCPCAEAIIMTAHDSLDAAVRSVHHGVFDFLRKPFAALRDVERTVQRALEKVRLDREERQARDRLADTAERYKLAARASSDGLWDWDLRANCLYLSERWLRMIGLREEDLTGDPADWLDRAHPEDAPRLRRALVSLWEGAETMEVEYRILQRDRSYRWVCVRGIAERDEHGHVYRVAGSQRDIQERKQAEARLQHAALHDVLTGLPNRALFLDRLEHNLRICARDRSRSFTVLFIDLDRFKQVNDSLGHEAGDALLVSVAERMHHALRESDTLARLGGDEFTVLLPDVARPEDAEEIIRRLTNALSDPVRLCGREVRVGASIGATMGDFRCQRAEDLLRRADAAMYHVKARGGGDAAFFDSAMGSDAGDQLALESDLRRAIEQDQLSLVYQPIVCLRSDEVAGFEALVRWEHPERGTLTPADFIPLAERTGLIERLGERVLHRACAQIARWRRTLNAELFVSVNLSGQQVRRGRLPQVVARALAACELPAEALKLEITEGVLMRDLEAAAEVLEELRRLGVGLSLDDFGTGYSSLSYLHRLPIDALKIDRSFVTRMGERGRAGAMVHAIVQMANVLGIEVIAEGVETRQHARSLHALGCDYGQGFHYGAPVQAQQAERLTFHERVSRTFARPVELVQSDASQLH